MATKKLPLPIAELTLRDYFAGQAMQGIFITWLDDKRREQVSDLASMSYMMADAMLAERGKQ